MQKRASRQYDTIFASLPTDDGAPFYIDPKDIALPFSEDFPKMHYHDRYEIGICERGEGLFLAEGEFFSVSQSDVIFVPPGCRHYSRSLSSDSRCMCRFLYVNAKKVNGLVCAEADGQAARLAKSIPTVLRHAEYPVQSGLLREIFEVCRSQKSNADRLAVLKLASFLLEWEQSGEPSEQKHTREGNFYGCPAERAAQYICLHYSEHQKAFELARIVHLSESQLRRQFIRIYKMPPIAYRNRVRCRIAAELLTKSTLSIAEIADRVGFGSTSDFYRAFRTFYAVSPSEHRKESKWIS